MKDKLKKLIIKAVPEIEWLICPACEEKTHRKHGYCLCGGFLRGDKQSRQITLADVLVAYKKRFGYQKFTRNETAMNILFNWNLKENLDGQSDETIEFLYELLK